MLAPSRCCSLPLAPTQPAASADAALQWLQPAAASRADGLEQHRRPQDVDAGKCRQRVYIYIYSGSDGGWRALIGTLRPCAENEMMRMGWEPG
jgi:hypothetical protein